MSEEINEISKGLRKRYIKAATKDLNRRHAVISKQRSGDRSNELAKKNIQKSGERAFNIAKAKETSTKQKKVVIKPPVAKKDDTPKKPKVSIRSRIGSIVKKVFSKRKKVEAPPVAKKEAPKVSNKGPIVRDMEKVVSALRSDAAKRNPPPPRPQSNVVRLKQPTKPAASSGPVAKNSAAKNKAKAKDTPAPVKKPSISAKPLPKKK